MVALYLSMARHAVAFLAYTALTLAFTWPLILQLGSAVPNDLGDPLLSTWTLWWNASALPLTDRWWNGPIFFPAPDTLTLSDHRIGVGIISTPAIWLGSSPVVAYNLAFLASFMLSAIGGYALGWSLTRQHGAAFLAGLVFGFNPFRAGHLSHLELLCSYWLPVALLALHRWGETRKPVWLVGLSAALTMQALTSVYYFAFFAVIIGLWLVWFVRWRLQPREYVWLGASLVTPLLLIAPILMRYRRAHESMGLARTIEEIETFSADLVGLVTAPRTLALWNPPPTWEAGEGALYPGAVAVALVVAGVIATRTASAAPRNTWLQRARHLLLAAAIIAGAAALIPVFWGPVSTQWLGVRISITESFKPTSAAVFLTTAWLLTSRPVSREWQAGTALPFFALTTVAMWVFALGPTGYIFGERFLYKAPYAWLMLLPGVDTAFRAPARFGMLAALTLSAATALAWAGLARRRSRQWTVVGTAIAALAIAADSWIKPLPLPSLPAALTLPADAPPDAVVLELPLGPFEDATAMYRAIDHRRATVNGLSGYAPPSYQVLHAALHEGRVEVLNGLALFAPLVVFVDRRAAGDQFTSLMRAFPTATLVRHDATHDVLLIARPAATDLAHANLRDGIVMESGRASFAGDSVALMSDGDRRTAWVTPTQQGNEEFIADLGRAHQVAGIVFSQGAWPNGFPRTLSVLTSVDDAEWVEAWGGDVASLALHGAVADQGDVAITLRFRERQARYIRVRQVAGSSFPWAVAEFRALVQ
jgi:hypothetical protein